MNTYSLRSVRNPIRPALNVKRLQPRARRGRLITAAAAAALTLTAALAPMQGQAQGKVRATQTAAPAAPAPVSPAPVSESVPASGVALTATDLNNWLDGYLPYAIRNADIAGTVVAVVKDGEIVTERGYGFSDVEKRTPVDPQRTLFRPGSVSKLLTWTAVMQQVEQGKIDLDADINKYLDFQVNGLGGKPITMRNLMQHTAGFEEQAKGIISAKNDIPSFDVLLKRWVPDRVFAVGSTPAYSNYGASLAGYIVQRVSGEPFDAYIEHHILEPLDMKHSSFRQPLPKELEPLMSKGYHTASDDAKPFEYIGPAPAGSLSSTAEDMAHFMIAHLQNGEYHGNRILRADTAETMHNSPLTVLPPLNRMELGFFETNINGREVIAHLGDTEWFHTSLHLFVKENVGLYVSFNSVGKEGAAGTLRGALFQDFADRYFPAAEPHATAAKLDEKTAMADAVKMSGAWDVSRGGKNDFLAVLGFIGQTKVGASKKGELVLPFPGFSGKPRHWVEIAPFVWQDTSSHDRAAAKVVDGVPVRFSFDMLSPFMVFDRAPWYQSSSWLMPLLVVGCVALALTALLWPVAAIIRRRHRVPLTLDPRSLRAHRGSRLGAVAIVAGLFVWGLIVMMILKDTGTLGGRLDPWLVFAQLFGIVTFIGGLILMLRNLVVVWGGKRRWTTKLWSLVLVVSAASVVWVACVFDLFMIGTNY